MIPFLSEITIKNTAKTFLMSVLLSGTFANVGALEIPNGIEMGLALATIPFDSAAHHYDLTDNKKTAAFLHLTTATISILNKLCFFSNNISLPARGHAARYSNRDSIVNAAWLARDITRFFQHLKAYRSAKNSVDTINAFDDNDDVLLSFNETLDAELKPEEISRLAYTCQVILLPMLRGASACALAWSQSDNAIDQFQGINARFLATAVHSLVRLSEEYTELEAGSSYKKLLAVGLIANTLWLAKEIKDYHTAYQAYQADQERLRQLRLRQLGLAEGEEQRLRGLGQGAHDPELARIMQRIRVLRGEDAELPVLDPEQQEWQDILNGLALGDEQANFARLLQQENPVDLPLQPRGECTLLCGDDNSENLRRLVCGHTFCMDCLGGYVGNAIDEGHAAIQCPHRGCNHVRAPGMNAGEMRDGEIRAIIQANPNLNQNRYNQIKQQGVRGARICPTADCPHVFGNPNSLITNHDCPECNQWYCANCTIPHARNISCMRARIESVPGTREWLDGSENRSLCPGCFTRIERMNMCPNMNCGEARCRRAFCLYCHRDGGHADDCPNRWFDATPDARAQGR